MFTPGKFGRKYVPDHWSRCNWQYPGLKGRTSTEKGYHCVMVCKWYDWLGTHYITSHFYIRILHLFDISRLRWWCQQSIPGDHFSMVDRMWCSWPKRNAGRYKYVWQHFYYRAVREMIHIHTVLHMAPAAWDCPSQLINTNVFTSRSAIGRG